MVYSLWMVDSRTALIIVVISPYSRPQYACIFLVLILFSTVVLHFMKCRFQPTVNLLITFY